MMADTVTMTLETEGSNADSVLIKGPVRIAGTVASYSDLPAASSDGTVSFGGETYDSTQDLTVLLTGSYPRYYQFDWDAKQWRMIVIGSHSHSDIAILDQLGNIDASELKSAKKMLVISTDDDGSGETVADAGYKLEWQDLPNGLPAIPDSLRGKDLYLTMASDGSYEWSNGFAPAQTFQMKRVSVALGDPAKKIIIPGMAYDPSIGDELLLFDGRDFISDFSASEADGSLTVTLPDGSGDTFDEGETVTALVIRSGIQGLLDTISREYITKQDFLKMMSNGSIDLNTYLTKADAKKTYALRQHTHSQFAAASHSHDGVYADYNHTHPEYMTKAEIQALLLKTNGESASDVQTQLEALVESMEAAVKADLKTYDKAEIDGKLSAINAKFTTGSIADDRDSSGKTLTDSLNDIEKEITDASLVTASEVLMPTVGVRLNSPLGGYQNGDTISGNPDAPDTVAKVIAKLFSEPKREAIVQPEVTCEVSVANDEIGAGIVNVVVTPKFAQNSAGALKAFHISQTFPETSVSYLDKTAGGSWTLVANIAKGKSLAFTVTADYEANIKTDQVTGESYGIQAGTVSFSGEVDGVRKMFAGYVYLPHGEEFLAKDVRNAKHLDLPKADETVRIELVDTESDASKDRYIVIAYPLNTDVGDALSSVRMPVQGFEIKDVFTEIDDQVVPGADGQDGTGDSYVIYRYKLDQPIGESLTLDLTF